MTMLPAATLVLAAVLAVALAACTLLRRRSAAWRHAVLVAALLVGAAAPAFNGLVPPWQLPVAWEAAASVPVSVPDVLIPLPASAPPPIAPVAPAPVAPSGVPLAVVLAIGWVAGAMVSFWRLALGLLRLSRLTRRCAPVVSGPWRDDADALAPRHGIARPVTLLQSDSAALLLTWGLVRPRIVLPAGAGTWDGERRAIVLAHELAHIRRYDWAVQVAAEIVRAVHWCNPLVWIACRRLRRESEHACDDVVLTSGIAPTTYASHLLAVARHGAGVRTKALAPAVASVSTLERRIAAMLRPAPHRDPLTWRFGALALTGALAVTVPLAAAGVGQRPDVAVPSDVAVTSPAALLRPAARIVEVTPRQGPPGDRLDSGRHAPADPRAPVSPGEAPATRARQGTSSSPVAPTPAPAPAPAPATAPATAPRTAPATAPRTAPPSVPPDALPPAAPHDAAPDPPRPVSVRVPAAVRVPALTLAQQQLALVSGAVRDMTGGVMPGVRMALTDSNFVVRYRAITDGNGRFTIRNVSPGRYYLVANSTDQEPHVSLRGFATVTEPLDVVARAEADRSIMLPLRTLEDGLAVACPAEPIATLGTALQTVAFVPGRDSPPRPLAAPGTRRQAQSPGAAGAAAQGADLPRPVRVGGNFRFPERVTTIPPPCPRAGMPVKEMTLTAAARIGTDGSVFDVRLIAGGSGASANMVESALTTLRRWVYAPPRLNGQPVEIDLRVHITYHREG